MEEMNLTKTQYQSKMHGSWRTLQAQAASYHLHGRTEESSKRSRIGPAPAHVEPARIQPVMENAVPVTTPVMDNAEQLAEKARLKTVEEEAKYKESTTKDDWIKAKLLVNPSWRKTQGEEPTSYAYERALNNELSDQWEVLYEEKKALNAALALLE